MRRAGRDFVRGPVAALATALGVLTTMIAVVQFVNKSGAGWMWMFFGAVAFVALAFWQYYKLHTRLQPPAGASMMEPAEVAEEFSAFVAKTNALRPSYKYSMMLAFEDRAAHSRLLAERNQESDRVYRDALREYYERFREPVLALLRASGSDFAEAAEQARQPDSFGKVAELADAVKRAAEQSRASSTPSARAGLARWLGEQIQAINAFRHVIDEEANKPVPEVDRTDHVWEVFWHANREIAARLQATAPEWADYYRENPDWFSSQVVPVTSQGLQGFGRFLGYTTDRLAHIKSRLP